MRALIILGLLLTSGPGLTTTQQISTTTVTYVPADPGDRIVCRRNKTTETGSRLRGRGKTCMRAAEWKEFDLALENFKQGLINRPPHAADPAFIQGPTDPNAPPGTTNEPQ